MYDIFYVSKDDGNEVDWLKIKSKYPQVQKLTNVQSHEQIRSKAFTSMFWVIWDDLDLNESFNLLEYTANKWDNMYVHVFRNGQMFDGVCLFPKSLQISNREFQNRYFMSKKEVDIEISKPKRLNIYSPNTYEEYQAITDDLFWIVWPEIEILDDSIFDFAGYDRKENHLFKNLCNDRSSYINGVLLNTSTKKLSKREFEKRYAVDKKEHDKVVSRYRYPRYSIASYDEYSEIVHKEKQPMFWCIWPEINITDETIFDFYFDPFDGTFDHDRKENHTFKHIFNHREIYINGLVLFSTQKIIGRREFQHRFLIEKKEHDRIVSEHRVYDVVFISYNEPNADTNYEKLLEICPRAKRVHGVKGIHNAHIRAAELCDTDMIWVVDGDSVIENNFNFDLVMTTYDIDCVHVWRSKNPINDLEYGNGGIKLLPRNLTLNMDVTSSDMTTSISSKFKAMTEVSNVNAFNTDEYTTWRSAFRECCKLASRTIERQHEEETAERLDIWCSKGSDRLFGKFALDGAAMGREYGTANKDNPEALRKINDFSWLKEKFDERYRKN